MKISKMKKAQAGLSVSNKRVGPVDPKGAWTKVQEDNLPPKNKKTPVSLTKDKEQGATKMKMGGKMKKAQDGMQTATYKMGGSLKKIASGKKMAKTSVKMAKKKNDIMMSKSQTMKYGGKAKKK